MKTVKYLMATLLLVGLVSVAETQDYLTYLASYLSGETVSQAVAADDTDVSIIVKYYGSNAAATVEVEAGGDILFKEGGSADLSVICPVGGTGGAIDVSNAACNTFGEVVDIVNADPNWSAVILDGLRADSSNDTLLVQAASPAVLNPGGMTLLVDTSTAFTLTRALTDKRSMEQFARPRTGSTPANPLISNPWNGFRGAVFLFRGTSTYGSGTSTLQVLSVAVDHRSGTETVTTVWSAAGGATTVAATLDFTPFGALGRKNEKLMVRVNNSLAMSSATATAWGAEFPSR
jgi:hypothetical protein